MIDLNGTLLIQFLNFFILVAILAKFAYKPLLNAMKQRQEKIAGDLESAQQARLEAEQFQAEYKENLAKARHEAQLIMARAAKEAEEVAQQQLLTVREQIAREKDGARAEIAREREKALAAMRAEVVDLSVAVAEKILGKEIDAQANNRLISDAIDKLDGKVAGL